MSKISSSRYIHPLCGLSHYIDSWPHGRPKIIHVGQMCFSLQPLICNCHTVPSQAKFETYKQQISNSLLISLLGWMSNECSSHHICRLGRNSLNLKRDFISWRFIWVFVFDKSRSLSLQVRRGCMIYSWLLTGVSSNQSSYHSLRV